MWLLGTPGRVSWSIQFGILILPEGPRDLRLSVASFLHNGMIFLPEVRRFLCGESGAVVDPTDLFLELMMA